MTPALRALRRRLNALAYDQVNEELARLDQENEQLRTALAHAEDDAEHWHGQCLGMYHAQAHAEGGMVGLTQTGHLTMVPAQIAGHA